ncbi:DUF5711 family protein [Ruminococcus sp.]|uniref:DUF5711 family protein n=1 Tax=Ruminococcus sp. TaxID=41978 RepID=UPI00265B6518|nr:DUF5711 family protein [Ruminococcus sp.]MEE1396645.1 DUF5711 family protein [Ruminococcus sp.]
MSYDSDDVIEKRRKRHRMRTLRNFAIFLLIAVFCGYLYVQRDMWVPKLEGIGSRYQSVTQNDGTLAEGNFPLTISGNAGYQAELVDDTLFLLHDAYLDLYSMHGDSRDSRQHAYQDAGMASSKKYAVIFERGGTSFRLDTKNKNIYTKTAEADIIFGTVSSNGSVALVTESDAYTCSIAVYDNTGKRIYQRDCVEYVTDIVFRNDNAGCCFTSVTAENGVLQTTVTSIQFNKKEAQWSSLPLETLEVKMGYNTAGDTLCVIGDTACAYYSSTGELLSSYTYSGKLVDYGLEDGSAALIVEDNEKRQTNLVLMYRSAESPKAVAIDDSAECVRVSGGDAVVMYSGDIISYDFDGNALATVSLGDSYTSFLKQDGYVFLLGYHKIDRVDFKE